MVKITLAFILCILPLTALGDYIATWEIQGSKCIGDIDDCPLVRVDAVKGVDERYYKLQQRFEDVTSYNAAEERCWVKIETRGSGIFGWFNRSSAPDFYKRAEEGMQSVDIDYLTFLCREV